MLKQPVLLKLYIPILFILAHNYIQDFIFDAFLSAMPQIKFLRFTIISYKMIYNN